MFISVIIPIHNVASTVAECLTSAATQLPDDCEIVCVDDGSTDDSMKRVEQVRQAFPDAAARIRVVHQENQGLSVARNTGIALASADFIGLLDSDDVLRPGYFAHIRDIVDSKPDVEIICFNADRFGVGKDGEVVRQPLHVHPGAADFFPSRPQDFDTIAINFARCRWFSWARVYARRLFSLRGFSPGLKYQDMELLPELYLHARRVVNIDARLVDYRIHEASVTSRPNQSTLENLDVIIDYYSHTLADVSPKLNELRHFVVVSALESAFHAGKRMAGISGGRQAFRSRQREIGRSVLARFMGRHLDKYSSDSVILQLSPVLFLAVGRLRRFRREKRRAACSAG
ncbi:glycosyltransferase [Salinisphaera sp. Q1T1-3]|uniref:glycosyltransferase n=1 Tax=Salinisphaera sp. Q1T1-3 TaxID=2321229 RepID=UPI00210136B4|nr:glycosyltransferase [Salinisphaera sp. Q1T1-3]